MKLAPIVLFVYNRPLHTKQTVEALQKNELAMESELFIYSDAAKIDDVNQAVAEVRLYLKSINGFKKITIIERNNNCGLANSIIDGVTTIVNQYGKIIVLEDDLLTSPYFLRYMNDSLAKYQNESSVFSITGYSHSNELDQIDSTYFLKLTSSWSWGTWREKWRCFSHDPEIFKACYQNKFSFNFDDSYDFSGMSNQQLKGKIDSWAIFWYASVFLKNGLTLYPKESFVKNIGFDGSGTHCGFSDRVEKNNCSDYLLTDEIYEKKIIKQKIVNIFKLQKRNLLSKNTMLRLRNLLSDKHKWFISLLISKIKLLFLKKKIGANSYIDPTVNVFGWSHVSIGSHTLIGEQSWLNVNDRESGFDHINIGNYCYIGRRNLLSSSRQLVINDYVMTNNECKFLGSNHIFSDPNIPYIATGATNDGVLKIGANVWIGAGVIVLGNITIGHGSIIGAGSVVTKNIPPFSIAVGNPCKVIKRYDFKKKQWVEIGLFDSSAETIMPTEEMYLKTLRANAQNLVMPKLAASSRFGDLF